MGGSAAVVEWGGGITLGPTHEVGYDILSAIIDPDFRAAWLANFRPEDQQVMADAHPMLSVDRGGEVK
jgi:hypothetical protein